MSNMKSENLLPSVIIAASALASAEACGGQQPGSHAASHDARKRLIGAWRLASLEEPSSDGTLHRVDCSGLLVFTRDGYMSVQVMYPDQGNVPGGSPYAQDGYEASFGTYEVDDGGRTFTYRVEGALVRTLITHVLPRAFELVDGRLVVRSSNADEHWRVIWERGASHEADRH